MHLIGYGPTISCRPINCTVHFLYNPQVSDYITIHVPYIKGATHHLINATNLKIAKPGVHLLNFSRDEIIDGEAVLDMYKRGSLTGKYVSDFSNPHLTGHPRHLVLPHLGASTEEAEDNSAAMAAETIQEFLETGSIRNSVNFPQVGCLRCALVNSDVQLYDSGM